MASIGSVGVGQYQSVYSYNTSEFSKTEKDGDGYSADFSKDVVKNKNNSSQSVKVSISTAAKQKNADINSANNNKDSFRSNGVNNPNESIISGFNVVDNFEKTKNIVLQQAIAAYSSNKM